MYKVNFVNDQEFDALPGNNMESKIGVAYPEQGLAYVRASGSSTMDVFTALHELEHLKGSDLDEHFDSENKCYYKDFGSVMDPIAQVASFIPGPWQAPAAVYSTVKGGINAFGGDQKQQQPQQQPNIYPMTPEAPQAPFTSQASGAGAGAGTGQTSSSQGGVKALQGQPQFNDIQNQRYGNISGRSPLMNMFGGQ